MPRWNQGSAVINRLLDQHQLERVPALLTHQGLRPTSSGGHLAVIDALDAQFPAVPGLKSLDRLRRRRNQAEYPDPAGYDPVTTDEAAEAITVANACIDSAAKLLVTPQLGVY